MSRNVVLAGNDDGRSDCERESTTWAWGEDKGNGIVVKGQQEGNKERKRIRSPNVSMTLAKSQPVPPYNSPVCGNLE